MSYTTRFYIDLDTQERVPAIYQVYLTMPACYDACMEIRATSEEEAIEMALATAWSDAVWECDSGDRHNIGVSQVECDEPPEGAFFVERECYTGDANLDSLFETEPTEPPASLQEEDEESAATPLKKD